MTQLLAYSETELMRFLLILARVSPLMLVAPLWGSQLVPGQVRVYLSMLIAALLLPAVRGPLPAGLASSVFPLLFAVGFELLLGLVFAYVALLLAGARPSEVRGAILCDGLGLAGGGPTPLTPQVIFANPNALGTPDRYGLAELSRDVRPPDYATAFLRQAHELSGLDPPVSICAMERPDWLVAVAEEMDVDPVPVAEALRMYARVV